MALSPASDHPSPSAEHWASGFRRIPKGPLTERVSWRNPRTTLSSLLFPWRFLLCSLPLVQFLSSFPLSSNIQGLSLCFVTSVPQATCRFHFSLSNTRPQSNSLRLPGVGYPWGWALFTPSLPTRATSPLGGGACVCEWGGRQQLPRSVSLCDTQVPACPFQRAWLSQLRHMDRGDKESSTPGQIEPLGAAGGQQ